MAKWKLESEVASDDEAMDQLANSIEVINRKLGTLALDDEIQRPALESVRDKNQAKLNHLIEQQFGG